MTRAASAPVNDTHSHPRRRLPHGGLIDRSTPLSFTFDGRSYLGFAGDTLASALIANDVGLVGRSFKYHRPRGIFTAGPEEPNALVELRDGPRREPNTRATVVELFDGLVAASQNRWPSLAFDVMAVTGWLSPFFPAGFYYKTFMWPPGFWEKVYEPTIRRAAGLGRAAPGGDPDEYEKAFAHCDVLVIGSGPTGLMAAVTAARAGARVILAEEDFRLGGRLLAERHAVGERDGASWVAAIEAELASMPEVRIMRRTSVFGVYDHGQYGAVERVSDHFPSRRRISRASASGRSSPGARCWPRARANGRSPLPATIVRASCSRAPCALTSTALPPRRRHGWSCSPTMTMAGAPQPTPRKRASPSRPSSIHAPTRSSVLPPRHPDRRACSSGRKSQQRRARKRSAPSTSSMRRARRSRSPATASRSAAAGIHRCT